MMRTWAIANQKGGVGKTTTTLALGRALALRDKRVLLIDLDPHASLTCSFGVATDPAPEGTLELFSPEPAELATLARAGCIEGLEFVCAQAALATLERRSATQPGLGLALSRALDRVRDRYDYALLDCPPTLGLLMVNALAAADRVVIPTQAEPLAMHGLAGMYRTAQMVERSRRRPMPISVLPTMFDRRTRVGRETLLRMQELYGRQVWDLAIPVDTRLCNAEELVQPGGPGKYSGRALSAYRRALDWILADENGDSLKKAA